MSPMAPKQIVPGEVRLDQARHQARKAFGRGRIVVNLGASDAYREGWERIFGGKELDRDIVRKWKALHGE